MRAPGWRRRLRSQAERDAAIRRHIRRPPSHWVIVSACVLVLLVLLLVQGFTVLTTGSSGTPRPGTGRAPLAGLPSCSSRATGDWSAPTARPAGGSR